MTTKIAHSPCDLSGFRNIPEELRALPQWVAWRYEKRDGKYTKIPYDPKTGERAKSSDLATWGTFNEAVQAAVDNDMNGIGFQFSGDDPYVGIDLDKCYDPESGKIEPWAEKWIYHFKSYTEITPSGKGFHIIVRGALPPGGNRKGQIEAYSQRRYFTFTGNVYGSSGKVEERGRELQAFHEEVFSKPENGPQNPPTGSNPGLSDDEIVRIAKSAANGDKFKQLWAGNWKVLGYPSQSEADQALSNALAFYANNDPARIDNLFRQSGLYRPKWDRKDYSDETIQKAISSTTETYSPRDEAESEGVNLTDLGNARRFADRHRGKVRYCALWDRWLVYDGRHWKIDSTLEIYSLARATIRGIFHEAAECADKKQRRTLTDWGFRSESRSRIEAMVNLSKSEPGIPIEPQDLDRDDWLLNCLNGTIDLRTGVLRPHDSNDLITKTIPVEIDPRATCPTWELFLHRIMDGNAELIAFLQRAIGYALTGDISEQVLFLFYGTGANGKSTFLDTIRLLLNTYAKQAEFSTFLVRKNDSVRNDIADLRGARFVAALEAESGQRLAEALIKSLTGGDAIKARYLFQEHFEFVPTFKIFLASNHKPTIQGNDHAMWRRMRMIPFTVTIPEAERDPRLKDKLREELPGILNWALLGCAEWQEKGVGLPDAVKNATAAYRNEMDYLNDFITESCLVDSRCRVSKAQLYEAYEAYCTQMGDEPLKKRAFGQQMIERGFDGKQREANARYWQGIGLLDRPSQDGGEASDTCDVQSGNSCESYH